MKDKNILFITEGEKDEVELLEKLFEIYNSKQQYKIYSYKTTIHYLAKILFENNNLDEDFDILLLLKSYEKDDEKRKILSGKYTDIILMFDFEPQHHKTRFKQIEQMLIYFNDSTDNGKLYINYPMMQSYKHLKTMPDKNFITKKATLQDAKQYKNLVAKQSKYTDLSKYNYIILTSIILHHIKKLNYILNSKAQVPTYDEFIKMNLIKLYQTQCEMNKEEKSVYILNTGLCYIIEYAPQKFFSQLEKHKENFLI